MEEKTMLSQGEWRIMNLLWKKKNRTIMEMVEDFAGVTDWDKHTLIVMLKRMEAKGVVAYETVGRAKPLLSGRKTGGFCAAGNKEFFGQGISGKFWRDAYDNGKTGTAQRAGSKTIAAAFGRDRRERVNIWESMC